MSPEQGRRFGPYQIQGRLGGGGMGHVFRAWDARLHREVAIKLLHDEFSMPGMRERFLREARAASALNHPHICTVFDIGEQNGEPYLVMELLEGETLKDRIQRSSMSPEDLTCIAREVAEALAAAHSKGVIHRDIKPANIFLVDKPNGKVQAKVLDFGLAKIEGGALGARTRSRDITSAGATVGTLAYMSPEQARGEVLDSRSDLFSLGVVLYEMATRQVPFQGATSALVFVKLLNHPPAPVRDWNESIPRDLEKIIFKLMAKERTARFQTAQELDDALARMNEKSTGGGWLRKAVATVPLVRVPEPIARERRASRKLTREASAPVAPAQSGPPRGNSRAGDRVPPSDREYSPNAPEQRRTRSSPSYDRTPQPPAAAEPPNAPSQSAATLLLRPVARIPRDDSTPQPLNAVSPSTATDAPRSISGQAAADPGARTEHDPGDFGQMGESSANDRSSSGSNFAAHPDSIPNPSAPSRSESISAASLSRTPSPNSEASRPFSSTSGSPTPVHGEQKSGERESLDEPGDSPFKDSSVSPDGRGGYGSESAFDPLDENEMVFNGPALRDRKRTTFLGAAQTGEARPAVRGSARARTGALGIAVVAVLLIGFVFFRNRGRFGPAPLTRDDRLLVTQIQNQTGDKVLDGTLGPALFLALHQSPYLRLVSGEAIRSAARLAGLPTGDAITVVQAHTLAERLGSRAYLYGSIKGASAPYLVHVDLLATQSNDVIASVEERAESLQQVPAAIDRLSDDLRASAGEDTDSITGTHSPLSVEATGNLDALHSFATAEEAFSDGRVLDALGNYQRAVQLEPVFLAAQLRLVTLYRMLHAETAEADAARLALAASGGASPRSRNIAQYQYEISVSGDYQRALAILRQILKDRPNDAETLAAYALVERLLGRLTDSLQNSQQALTEDPWCLEAYTEAQNTLVALDRYDAALQLEDQAQRLGLRRIAGALIPAYLEGRREMLARAAAEYEAAAPGQRPDWRYALYLDNAGRLSEGLALWRSNAEALRKYAGLESEASFLLAQGAVDRALLGDCTNALALAEEAAEGAQGLHSLFNTGITHALCHQPAAARAAIETLRQNYPQSTEVKEYLLPDLEGSIALAANDPAAGFEALKPARQYDLLSLTPYLRGLCHVSLRQVQIGIVDFQTVLSHRGFTLIAGTSAYPASEIGVARAFADTGDISNSAEAYRRFLDLWKTSEEHNSLLTEAHAKAR